MDDYGCGYGAYLDYLHERGFERLDYLGLDISPDMVNEARRLHPHGDVRSGQQEPSGRRLCRGQRDF